MQHMLYYAIIMETARSCCPSLRLSSAAAQQKSSAPLRQSLLPGAVKGLQALEAAPWPPCHLLVCLPPPRSSLLIPPAPSSTDPPQACETSLTTLACSDLNV